jgi:hypothetical protein
MRLKIIAIVCLLCCGGLSIAQIPTDGLVAYYSFNNRNANNEAGTNDNGDVSHLTNPDPYVTDRAGTGLACRFDGKDDFINIGNMADFGFPSDSFAISAWYFTDGCAPNAFCCKCLYDIYGRSNAEKTRDISVFVTTMNDKAGAAFQLVRTTAWVCNSATAVDSQFLSMEDTVRTPGWHHTAVLWKKPVLSFFVDGAAVGSRTATITDPRLSTSHKIFNIGADRNTTPGQFYCGQADDIRVYKRALSASEITILANESANAVIPLSSRHNGLPLHVALRYSAQGLLSITAPVSLLPITSISIFDTRGRVVANLFSGSSTSLTHNFLWPGNHAPAGAYFVAIESVNGRHMAEPIMVLR